MKGYRYCSRLPPVDVCFFSNKERPVDLVLGGYLLKNKGIGVCPFDPVLG